MNEKERKKKNKYCLKGKRFTSNTNKCRYRRFVFPFGLMYIFIGYLLVRYLTILRLYKITKLKNKNNK